MSAAPHRPAEPPPMPGMWDDERAQPLRYALLYLGALFGSLLASHLAAWWGSA